MKRPHLNNTLEYLSRLGETTVIDIGAYTGKLARFFRDANSKCIVHAIEAEMENFKILKHKTAGDKNIFCHNIAIADIIKYIL